MARYRKFHSKYSLEQKHQTLTNGDTIWEKDWSTVRGPIIGNFGANAKRKYTDGNFTFVTTNIPSPEKKHTIANEGDVFTYDQVSDAVRTKTINNKLPEFNSDDLRDYAYFGSAYELVRTSIENIVKNFPPKMYTDHNYLNITPLPGDYNHDVEYAINDKKQPYYVLNNPFKVDFLTQHPVIEDGENPLHYMSTAHPFFKVVTYKDGKADCEYNIDSYEIELVGNKIGDCFEEKFNVYFHMPNGNVEIVSETINSTDTFEQIANGTKKRYISAPSVANLEYWVKIDKKDDTTHSPNDKYGNGYNSIEFYSNNDVHFYPILFNPTTYYVYFHNVDGSQNNSWTKTYTVNTRDELNQIENGKKLPVSNMPSIDNLLYWVQANKKDTAVTSHTENDKFGTGYNSIDMKLHNGVHFYPVMFQAVTYNVYFHMPDSTVKTATKVITDNNEYNQIVAGTKKLPLQASDIPSVTNLVFWVLENKRTATSFNDSDKHTNFDFKTDNGIHYYPFIFEPVTYAAGIYNPNGSLIKNQSQTISKYNEYEQIQSGKKTYLSISNLDPQIMYFVPENKKNTDASTHTANDKYGPGFQSINIFDFPNTEGKFYAVLFKSIEYSVSFYDTSGTLLKKLSKTISTKTDFDNLETTQTLPVNTNEIPTIDGLDYWVLKTDKDKTEHTSSQKYGVDGTQTIDLYKNNGAEFYPIVKEVLKTYYLPVQTGYKGLRITQGYRGVAMDDNRRYWVVRDDDDSNIPLISWANFNRLGNSSGGYPIAFVTGDEGFQTVPQYANNGYKTNYDLLQKDSPQQYFPYPASKYLDNKGIPTNTDELILAYVFFETLNAGTYSNKTNFVFHLNSNTPSEVGIGNVGYGNGYDYIRVYKNEYKFFKTWNDDGSINQEQMDAYEAYINANSMNGTNADCIGKWFKLCWDKSYKTTINPDGIGVVDYPSINHIRLYLAPTEPPKNAQLSYSENNDTYYSSVNIYDKNGILIDTISKDFSKADVTTYYNINQTTNVLQYNGSSFDVDKCFIKPNGHTSTSKYILKTDLSVYNRTQQGILTDTTNGINMLKYSNVDLIKVE